MKKRNSQLLQDTWKDNYSVIPTSNTKIKIFFLDTQCNIGLQLQILIRLSLSFA